MDKPPHIGVPEGRAMAQAQMYEPSLSKSSGIGDDLICEAPAGSHQNVSAGRRTFGKVELVLEHDLGRQSFREGVPGTGPISSPRREFRACLYALSDVLIKRPPPRHFDQIYMKTADMVLQSEFVAHSAAGRRVGFIGDGDAISVCVAHLHHRGILSYGPAQIVVFDFDERICNAMTRFADTERIENLSARLYNALDAFRAWRACRNRTGSWHKNLRRSGTDVAASVPPTQLVSTGRPARRHSGKPTSKRRAFSPRACSSRTASSA